MRTPKTLLSDLELADAVMAELEWDERVNAVAIRVTAKDGAVRLSGHVHSYPEKWAAVRAAERVYGVRAVADDIDVTLPSGVARDDREIAAEIARQRSSTTWIPDSIEVEVTKGHVTLHGEVQSAYQREDAARAIRHVKGVRGVSNGVTVSPRPEADATDVERRIEDAIERQANLDAHSIRVTKSDGTVRLHGSVHSLAEFRLAQRAAEAAPGVTKVENDLVVTP
jgi:osmotically-inducible protein OsmY